MIRYLLTYYRPGRLDHTVNHMTVDAQPWFEQASPRDLDMLAGERAPLDGGATAHYTGVFTRSILDWLNTHYPTTETRLCTNGSGQVYTELDGDSVDQWLHKHRMKSLAVNAVNTLLSKPKR